MRAWIAKYYNLNWYLGKYRETFKRMKYEREPFVLCTDFFKRLEIKLGQWQFCLLAYKDNFSKK